MTNVDNWLARLNWSVTVRSVSACLGLASGLFCAMPIQAGPPLAAWHVAVSNSIVTREIRFTNGGVQLVGTLSLPANGSHLPALIVTHGAEVPIRDDALYRHLQQDLPALGYAVFVYDRRGSGASGGNREEADYTVLADDAVAAQRVVAADPRIDPRATGFWGLSQGGWLAVLAAARSPGTAFAVSISAPLTSPAEQMGFAVSNLLSSKGFTADDIRQAVATRHTVEDYLRGRSTATEAQRALDAAKAKPWFGDIFMEPKINGHPERSEWRREMDYDPVAPLMALKIPVLVMYGSDDPWVPVAASLERLKPLRAQHRNLDIAVIPNADHEMMRPRAANPMPYDAQSLKEAAPEVPQYFMMLANWLSRHAHGA